MLFAVLVVVGGVVVVDMCGLENPTSSISIREWRLTLPAMGA